MNTAQPAAQQLPPQVHNPHVPAQAPAPKQEVPATPRSVDWNNPRVAAILDAAAKCFARKGFSATTLAEIGKELGLRKSIVHYYFESKAALIHEVQSYTNNKYLQTVTQSLDGTGAVPGERVARILSSLWSAAGEDNVGLNIEVWSASRNDPELKRRAGALQKEKRQLVAQAVVDMLGPDAASRVELEPLCTLILGVLNGLQVSHYVEGEPAQAQRAYEIFLSLLRAAMQNPEVLR